MAPLVDVAGLLDDQTGGHPISPLRIAEGTDAWKFPLGTRLWKEFPHDGRRLETRYIERLADGSWRFAAYVWNDEGSDAALAPQTGLLRHLKPALLARPPRIEAGSALERAALGYLQANCGHCHNHNGPAVPAPLRLDQSALDSGDTVERVRLSTVKVNSRYRPPGMPEDARIVVDGSVDRSVLSLRMRLRHPQVQMPPIGTRHPDLEGQALIDRWINQLASSTQDKPSRAQVERGRYLVTTSGCHDCHTPMKMGANGPEPDMSRMLSGRPDAQTGLGQWSLKDFRDTIRTGRHLGRGREILPPIPACKHFNDADPGAILASLRSIPPVRNRVPETTAPMAAK